jgi:Ni/Co efflux regulator RcnB
MNRLLAVVLAAFALTAPGLGQALSGDHAKPAQVWRRGEHLPRQYLSHRYYLDPAKHQLRTPPAGYEWRLVGDHVYLVRVDTGLITAAVTALFPR